MQKPMEAVWKKVKSAIRDRIPKHSFQMWIEPLELEKAEDDNWILACPNFFSKKRVQDLYAELIVAELNKATRDLCRLSLVINGSRKTSASAERSLNHQLPLPNDFIRPHSGRFLRRDFTFDHFVVGANNDFAYSASLSLASRKDHQPNALFLLSNTGLGKSHLSQAVGHHVLSEHPEERVYYITAEDFSNEMVQAFQQDSISKFKGKYRNNCDVLLLEDVHYLSGKERTQVELAFTLDSLFEAHKRIIFSSCYLPSDIPKLNDELRSRLSCSLISNIEPPNFRTRVRILRKKAQINEYEIPDEVINYLASELTEDIRQLESGLNGVVAKSSLLGAPINLGLAASVVKNMVRQRAKITIDVIKKLVCKYYNCSAKEIISRSRKQSLVRPRQIAIYLSRHYTDAPLQSIGKAFNRYHATALHSIHSVERELKQNSSVQKQVEFFHQKLESGRF
jgi:chromosomal replication initiator protein